jgi:hypothetical protein
MTGLMGKPIEPRCRNRMWQPGPPRQKRTRTVPP